MGKVKIRLKKRNCFIFLIFLISFGLGIYSLINIVFWGVDSLKSKKAKDDIIEKVDVLEVIDDESVTVIEQEEEIEQSNPYWDYIGMSLINVNFDDLINKNSDTVGWIQVNGTNVNYPFVQGNDNDYYLNHSYDKGSNSAGWVYLDYRNRLLNDQNTIIYAHGRLDNSMFGSLRNILTNGWLNNSDNFVIKLSTINSNTLWQVFSVYRIPATNDYIETSFDDDGFINFTNMLIKRSAYNFNTSVGVNDKILTLSTCFNDNDRVVLHAKLIKIQER